jgi:hypothetical protein
VTTVTPAPGPFRHELVLHEGLDELVDLMAPFVRDGAAAGDHVVILGEGEFVDALLDSVPRACHVRALAEPGDTRYSGRELHRARQVLAGLEPSGRPVRFASQMPPVTEARRQDWQRYEAAVNVVLAPYHAWGKCAHDSARLDPGLVSDLRASHPLVQTPAGRHRNPSYDDTGARAGDFLDVPPHPIRRRAPRDARCAAWRSGRVCRRPPRSAPSSPPPRP